MILRGTPEYAEKNLSQCLVGHHKSHAYLCRLTYHLSYTDCTDDTSVSKQEDLYVEICDYAGVSLAPLDATGNSKIFFSDFLP